MPIYEYKCSNGHTFEVIASMTDDPVTECEVCGAPVERVFHPVAVHFKGSGFYSTDYAKKGAAAKTTSDGGEKKSSNGESKKSESGSKSESKSSGSSSGSGSGSDS